MDIRVLKYFITIAQESNITRAAKLLHTTQPNLSRQLNELEREIGKKLLERRNKKFSLTEEGLFLLKRAQEIVELVSRTESELSLFNDTISGDIYIGAAETNAMRDVSKIIKDLRKDYPKVRYHIQSESTAEVLEQLNKGLLDFGILVEPVSNDKYNQLELPFVDTVGVLMHKNSLLAEHDFITPNDIKDKPLLIAKQMLNRNDLSDWLGADYKNLDIVMTFNLITTPSMMIDEGLGYTFTLQNLVNTTGTNLCFKPLKPEMKMNLYLVWKKSNTLKRPAKIFLDKFSNILS